jgi:molybdate-binding protein
MRRELHALGRETINVRGPELLLAIATHVAVAEVVRQDENDVGFGSPGGAHGQHADEREEEA